MCPQTPPSFISFPLPLDPRSPFSILRFSFLDNALILHSATKDIRSAEIVSRASASAWATTLSFGLRRLLLRPFSQLQILPRRSWSILRALNHNRVLPIPLRLRGTCQRPPNPSPRPSTRNPLVPRSINTNTELLSIPPWELIHKFLQTCRTPSIRVLIARNKLTKVRKPQSGPRALAHCEHRLTLFDSSQKPPRQ